MTGGLGTVAYLGAWLTTIGGVWFLFEKADDTLAPEVRKRVSEWLRSEGASATRHTWSQSFLALFDRTFGARHLTWNCFQRSSTASICTVWVVAMAWMVTHPPPSVGIGFAAIFTLTLMGLVLNLLPDYVSLLETRWLLGQMGRSGPQTVLLLLLLDACATGVLGLAGYAVLYGAGDGLAALPRQLWRVISMQASLGAFRPSPGTPDPSTAVYSIPLGAFFYSTFFTSAWAWLFATSGMGLRVFNGSRRAAAWLWRVTDVEEKPFRALGLAAVIIVTALFVAGVPVYVMLAGTG